MKAVFINEFGGPEALVHGDRPEPEVAPGEVMLRVRASALNHLDLNLRAGTSYRGPLPRIMGCDVAGEVVTVSPQAQTSLKAGDRVLLDNRVKCGHCENCRLGLDQYLPNPAENRRGPGWGPRRNTLRRPPETPTRYPIL